MRLFQTIRKQEFLAAGTFTVPDKVYELDVEGCGGGDRGSIGLGGGGSSAPFSGGAGGAGAPIRRAKLAVTPGQIIAVTIGAGGSGANSGFGQASTFGTIVFPGATVDPNNTTVFDSDVYNQDYSANDPTGTATSKMGRARFDGTRGGGGGKDTNNTGLHGANSIYALGGAGAPGVVTANTGGGGGGGGAAFGVGGAGGTYQGGQGNDAAANSGAGGGGGGGYNTTFVGGSGGLGGSGRVIVRWVE